MNMTTSPLADFLSLERMFYDSNGVMICWGIEKPRAGGGSGRVAWLCGS